MLVLFETSGGFALFKVLDEGNLRDGDLSRDFQTFEAAQSVVRLKAFSKFKDTAEALEATTALVESKMSKSLKKFLQKNIVKKGIDSELVVADPKLGGAIKEKLGLRCVATTATNELIRGIRMQIHGFVGQKDMSEKDLKAMELGLAHSLSRYKLKFSPDKVDTMIVQAIGLLDDLDKELNTYSMRVREWYGWAFPELGRIVTDNAEYAAVVKKMGTRNHAATTDFSDLISEEAAAEVVEAARISMGTEISEFDMMNITLLCEQIISMSEYRTQLFDYLKNRMLAIAPNLTMLVGELVGARLIAHAGSLINLAKYPASTVQILGAEKALFRALKTKHDTPKYGLIYHASLVGQAAPKDKGKISRVLAAKCALSIRVDALGSSNEATVAIDHRAMVEDRMARLASGEAHKLGGGGRARTQQTKYEAEMTPAVYNDGADAVDVAMTDADAPAVAEKKRKRSESESESESEEEVVKEKKKDKKEKAKKKEKKKKDKKLKKEKKEKKQKKSKK